MAYDKKTFLKNVIVLHDSGEQENSHILSELENMRVKHERVNLDYGDYSFKAQGRDFSLSCVIERKAHIDELYGNLTKDRERIEREFALASTMANDFTLMIENCESWDYLKEYKVPDWQMKAQKRKVQNIGYECYQTINSWQSGNRYSFSTILVADKTQTASKILEHFYWYWRNYKILTANRRGARKTTKASGETT